MEKHVHAAALRAAAKVAFSMAFIGCSSPAKAPSQEAADGEGYDTVTSDVTEAPARGASGGASAKPAAPVPPCHKDAGTTTTRSCKEVVASAFPDAGWVSPGEGTPVSDQVKACCTELLTTNEFDAFAERWACCDAVGAFSGGGPPGIGMACTPWGPPVPPAMRRKPTKPPTQRPVHEAWMEVA